MEGASHPLCRGLGTAVARQREVEVTKDNALCHKLSGQMKGMAWDCV